MLGAYFFISCSSPSTLSEQDLYAYIKDEANGLSKQRTANGVTMQVSYRPDDFMLWQELEGEQDSAQIAKVFDRYSHYLYFTMRLSAGNKDALYGTSVNQADFNEKLQTLSFRMGQYVSLVTSNKDTIPVADSHYSRLFGMSKSNDILFVFNEEKVADAEWVAFRTQEFGFRTGTQTLRFQVADIEATPLLEELEDFRALASPTKQQTEDYTASEKDKRTHTPSL